MVEITDKKAVFEGVVGVDDIPEELDATMDSFIDSIPEGARVRFTLEVLS